MNAELFPKGEPTNLMVQLLVQTFGVPKVNSYIGYIQINHVLDVKHPEHRWWTLVRAWRKVLRDEHGLILRAWNNTAFLVLDAHGNIGYAWRKQKSGVGRFKDAARAAINTDRKELTEGEIRTADHVIMTYGTITTAMATRPKRINFKQLSEKP